MVGGASDSGVPLSVGGYTTWVLRVQSQPPDFSAARARRFDSRRSPPPGWCVRSWLLPTRRCRNRTRTYTHGLIIPVIARADGGADRGCRRRRWGSWQMPATRDGSGDVIACLPVVCRRHPTACAGQRHSARWRCFGNALLVSTSLDCI